ncbi:Crp/Fnr family transcriptional regulator [Saccharibacillus qingshengii]|uniref:Crp/Fnr family transcriptional regulator n=1 Tax=Saccharibacillus qingshengii TaxID=1763540 RepID=UPI0015537D18|nr:Crp/Fnr family transcriptional regulator [Saccharibacillus qingshengii]
MYRSVTDTPFFKDIVHQEDHEWVATKFREKKFNKGQVLYMHGDEGHEMYIIKSGALKIYRQDENREIIFGHQFPGEAIGELEIFHHDNHRTASVATMEKTSLWVATRTAMEELVSRYPAILRKTIYILSERLSQADRKLEYLVFLDVRIRVANLLLDLHSNFGKETETGTLIDWKITQQHLANMIGAGRESAARILNEFHDQDIIELKNRRIYILKLDALKRLAGGETQPGDERLWHSTHKYDLNTSHFRNL